MLNSIFNYILGGVLVAAAAGASAQENHLVMSEILVDSVTESNNNSAEYLEIFNPTASSIALDNYYVTDSNLYTSASLLTEGSVNVGNSDNILRFPAGTNLASGQVAVITYTGSAFLGDFFSGNLSSFTSLAGSPLIFEVTESDGAIPNMIVLNAYESVSDNLKYNFSRTNGGEFLQLFFWDGTSDLVKDVDIIGWGAPTGGNQFDPKDASNLGKNGTPYLVDNGTQANLSITPAPAVMVRTSFATTGETLTGGNGLTGHDESTEVATQSWTGKTVGEATPGLTDLVAVGMNAPPSISEVFRNLRNPTASQTINIEANVTDVDGTISSVKVYVNTGSGFSAVNATNSSGSTWTAVLGPYADDTVVKWYVEATDNDNDISLSPALAPADFNVFIVDNTPLQPGDVVMNEILYDNIGGDSYEFVELYNTRNTPIKLPYFRFADANMSWFVLPENAEIPANGYMILSLDPLGMELQYGTPVSGVQYHDWGTFVLNNGGDEIFLVHPNSFDFNGTTSYIDYVNYSSTSPWPEIDANTSGKTIELKNPALDNSVAANWAGSTSIGTPGAANSQLSLAPGISEVTRSAEFPAPSTPITISAKVTPVGSSTVAAVRVFVDTGSGFTPTAMTLTATPNVYSAAIGGYPEGTIVKYYIEAENNSGAKSVFPADAPTGHNIFHVNANPATDQDLVINEILYDNISNDAYEFVEIYNRRSTPIDLSYFRFGDLTANFFTFPQGATIAGNGFVIVTMDPDAFALNYTIPGGTPVYDWGTLALNNGGDLVYIAHPNSINFNGTTTNLDEVTYTNAAPWPVVNSNSTGKTIELKSPELDNSVGSNWGPAIAEGAGAGTPGAANTTSSNVNNWTLY